MPLDCSQCLARCKGECCQCVPIPARLLETHKPVREIVKILDVGVQVGEPCVVAVTESNRCPFLGEDFKCTIYDDRPLVCRKYGDESCIFMKCSWQDKDGRLRSRQERRAVEREQQGDQKRIIERLRSGKPLPSDLEEARRARESLSHV